MYASKAASASGVNELIVQSQRSRERERERMCASERVRVVAIVEDIESVEREREGVREKKMGMSSEGQIHK